jgi:hypothetical protein
MSENGGNGTPGPADYPGDDEPNGDDESEDYPTSFEPNGPEMSAESIWDNDEALESLKMEKHLHPEETYEDTAKRLFRESMPQIAMSLIDTALHSQNDNTRVAAGKYISDLVLVDQQGGTKAKWEEMLGEAISKVEIHANEGSGN